MPAKKVSKVSKIAKKQKGKSQARPVKKSEGKTKLSAEIFNISGKKEGSVGLSKEIFGAKINQKLLAQALRVYQANSTAHYGSTKTRAQVRGGGAKPWRQKGTGRARAGSRRSPLWVGGAKALGPKPRKGYLELPKKMKRQALISGLSEKASNGGIKVVSNLEKIEPKTKTVSTFLEKLSLAGSILFVVSGKNENVHLATRNIKKISLDTVQNLNTYQIIKNHDILFSKEALESLPSRFNKANSEGAQK